MENTRFCQSCEMPMTVLEHFGKNADGTPHDDYCCYCWENGSFTNHHLTLEQAIEFNIPFVLEGGYAKTEDEARTMLQESMPKLKRWAM